MSKCANCKRQEIDYGNLCEKCYRAIVLPQYRVKETKKK